MQRHLNTTMLASANGVFSRSAYSTTVSGVPSAMAMLDAESEARRNGKMSEATPENLAVNAKTGPEAPNTIGMEPGAIGGVAAKRETKSCDLAVHEKLRCFTRKTSRWAKQPQEKTSYSKVSRD